MSLLDHAWDRPMTEWSGWVKNRGIEPPHKTVEVKFRDGDTDQDRASAYYWEIDNEDTDIIAYRYKIPAYASRDIYMTDEEDRAWKEKEAKASANRNLYEEIKEGFEGMATMAGPDPYAKQLRYQDAKGEDWIDEFARTATVDEFRGAMRFTIGKYNRRAGKKDELIKEIEKMKDYCQRWIDYERSL